MVRGLRQFRKSEKGVTLLEALIVFPAMLFMIITFIEFGFGVFQWVQAGRAVAVGARLAAVSNQIAPTAEYIKLADYGTAIAGDVVPDAVTRVSCSGGNLKTGILQCDSAGLKRILQGTDGKCDPNIGNSRAGMCDLVSRLNPDVAANKATEKVVVTYTRDGLGYAQRRSGPVVTVTVQLRDMTFETFFLGYLFGLNTIPIRPNPVTFTGEDMASCNTPDWTGASFGIAKPC